MNDQVADDLVAGLKRGSHRSLTSIFNQFYPALCYFAERMILNREEAEDIVGETFVKLWGRHKDFETMQNIKAFLYISTRNACLNYIKQSERDNRKQQAMTYLFSGNEDHILTEITRAEVLREIYQAIETLPTKCKQIFKMSLEGMKNHEIAEELKLSVHTVKNQKVRAIDLLRIKLMNSNLLVLLYLHSYFSDKN